MPRVGSEAPNKALAGGEVSAAADEFGVKCGSLWKRVNPSKKGSSVTSPSGSIDLRAKDPKSSPEVFARGVASYFIAGGGRMGC